MGKHGGNQGGRETDYDPSIDAIAKDLAAGGKNRTQIAEALGINRTTLYRWMERHKSLSNAIKHGMLLATDLVEEALHKAACGYRYREDRLTPIGTVESVELERAPDTAAAKFLLKNRRPEDWQDKQQVDHSGAIPVQIMAEDQDL